MQAGISLSHPSINILNLHSNGRIGYQNLQQHLTDFFKDSFDFKFLKHFHPYTRRSDYSLLDDIDMTVV